MAALPVVRGIRRLIQNQPDPEFATRPDFLAAVKLLPKYNLSFDICIYHHQLPQAIELVRRCPEVSFVLDHIAKPAIKDGLMEPWATQMKALAALPNVHLLGNRQLEEIPAAMQAMDVCLMCYEVCDYTNFIHPLKLNEYLATGRPVVSSPIDSALPLGHVLHLAGSADEWSAAIGKALADPDTPAPAALRQAEAARHDWDILVGRIAAQFRRRLETPHG